VRSDKAAGAACCCLPRVWRCDACTHAPRVNRHCVVRLPWHGRNKMQEEHWRKRTTLLPAACCLLPRCRPSSSSYPIRQRRQRCGGARLASVLRCKSTTPKRNIAGVSVQSTPHALACRGTPAVHSSGQQALACSAASCASRRTLQARARARKACRRQRQTLVAVLSQSCRSLVAVLSQSCRSPVAVLSLLCRLHVSPSCRSSSWRPHSAKHLLGPPPNN
jgi:hypothetical protein